MFRQSPHHPRTIARCVYSGLLRSRVGKNVYGDSVCRTFSSAEVKTSSASSVLYNRDYVCVPRLRRPFLQMLETEKERGERIALRKAQQQDDDRIYALKVRGFRWRSSNFSFSDRVGMVAVRYQRLPRYSTSIARLLSISWTAFNILDFIKQKNTKRLGVPSQYTLLASSSPQKY